jgi:hypothetical protein
MKRQRILTSALVLGLLLALAMGISVRLSASRPSSTESHAQALAQEPEPPDAEAGAKVGAAEAVRPIIPLQGRLTDASGNPIDGTRVIAFTLYDQLTGGTVLCQDNAEVNVDNGLFNAYMHSCTSSDINGEQLWLGIQVEGDPEMTDRQPIFPVPYAWSLMPGAIISDTSSYVELNRVRYIGFIPFKYGLYAKSSALFGFNYGLYGEGGYVGVCGKSDSDYGVMGTSTSGTGIYGSSGSGVAISAGGSGVIQSTADTKVAVSPLKMVAYWGCDLELRPDGAYMEVRPNATGWQVVFVPVDLPSVLFGTVTRLKSARICYKCDQAVSYIRTTSVRYAADSGTWVSLLYDDTDQTSTGWECYSLTATTPHEIQGSPYVTLVLDFTGTGSGHDIRIGKITLTLAEE